MTATATGAYVDSSDIAAINAQLESLGVTGDKVIVIRTSGTKVYLGKVEVT